MKSHFKPTSKKKRSKILLIINKKIRKKTAEISRKKRKTIDPKA